MATRSSSNNWGKHITEQAERLTRVEAAVTNLEQDFAKGFAQLDSSIHEITKKLDERGQTNWGMVFGLIAIAGALFTLYTQPTAERSHENLRQLEQHANTPGHTQALITDARHAETFKTHEEKINGLHARIGTEFGLVRERLDHLEIKADDRFTGKEAAKLRERIARLETLWEVQKDE